MDEGLNRHSFFSQFQRLEDPGRSSLEPVFGDSPLRGLQTAGAFSLSSHGGERVRVTERGQRWGGTGRALVPFIVKKFLLNLLGWHRSIKPYRFQVSKSRTHHLHTASCTHLPNSSPFLPPFTPPCPLPPPHYGVFSHKNINPVGSGSYPYHFITSTGACVWMQPHWGIVFPQMCFEGHCSVHGGSQHSFL